MEEDVRDLPHSTSTDYQQNYGCVIWHFILHGIKIYSSLLREICSIQNRITVKIFMLNHIKIMPQEEHALQLMLFFDK